MAIICWAHELLFIMAPHTGCTAVGVALRDHLAGEFLPADDVTDRKGEIVVPRKHSQLAQLLDGGVLSPQDRVRLTVASTIRNPYDALVSHYLKVHERFESDPDHRPGATKAAQSFEGWLRWRFRPTRWERIRGHHRDEAVAWTRGSDVILRHETLQADFDALMARLGVTEHVEIPRTNVTRARARRPYQEFYTPLALRIVEQEYAADLAEFGYRFEPPAG